MKRKYVGQFYETQKHYSSGIEDTKKITSNNIIHHENSNNYLDLNVFNTQQLKCELIYNYEDMKKKILANFKQEDQNYLNNIRVLKIRVKNDFVSFYLPHDLNITLLLDSYCFDRNFYNAFKIELKNYIFNHKHFPLVQIKINNSVNSTNSANSVNQSLLNVNDLTYFRQIICLSFAYLFNINFKECACYPQTINQLIYLQSGINMNCINAVECKTFLLNNPEAFDSLVIGPCQTADILAVAINSISAFALNGDNNINVDVKMIFDELKTLIKNYPKN